MTRTSACPLRRPPPSTSAFLSLIHICCPPELYGKATLRLSAKCGDSEIDYAEKVNFCVSTARIDVADAKLWWVRDYGEPNLYEARVSLISENGEVLDEKQYRFGLRTVEIERSDLAGKENGGKFRVLLNGTPDVYKRQRPNNARYCSLNRAPYPKWRGCCLLYTSRCV